MSTNRDASNTTLRRGQLALYTYRNSKSDVLPEQAVNSMNLGPTASVPAQVYVGAQLIGQTNGTNNCACTSSVTLQGYDKKSPAC
jgi:hypothetical protein